MPQKKKKCIQCALMSSYFKIHIQIVGKMHFKINKKMTRTNKFNVLASKATNEFSL